jgi:repressor LexA
MLTRKQHELLCFINDRLLQTGVSPSFEEMKEALDLKSKSGVHRLISALEERNFIRRLPNRARALEVLRMPETATAKPTAAASGKAKAAAPAVPQAANENVLEIPLHGRIAAGLPIEAMRDSPDHIEVPIALLGAGEHYALEVAGDSMVDAGILDGDTVIIRRTDSADNGQIVVALVDENEVTLKRLRRKGASIALEPANTRHETRIFPADRVRVQGRLVGLLRNYH